MVVSLKIKSSGVIGREYDRVSSNSVSLFVDYGVFVHVALVP